MADDKKAYRELEAYINNKDEIETKQQHNNNTRRKRQLRSTAAAARLVVVINFKWHVLNLASYKDKARKEVWLL